MQRGMSLRKTLPVLCAVGITQLFPVSLAQWLFVHVSSACDQRETNTQLKVRVTLGWRNLTFSPSLSRGNRKYPKAKETIERKF